MTVKHDRRSSWGIGAPRRILLHIGSWPSASRALGRSNAPPRGRRTYSSKSFLQGNKCSPLANMIGCPLGAPCSAETACNRSTANKFKAVIDSSSTCKGFSNFWKHDLSNNPDLPKQHNRDESHPPTYGASELNGSHVCCSLKGIVSSRKCGCFISGNTARGLHGMCTGKRTNRSHLNRMLGGSH